MKVPISCFKCQAEDGAPNFSALEMVRIPESGIFESRCNRGHQTFTVIQQTKFEILSEMAIQAIIDEYYRDAIASFIGSLERIYEFFVEAVCRKRDIEQNAFAASWKHVAKQSERQLGAFVIAFLLENGTPPKLLPQSMTELRNDVIHKGKFPDRAEAVRFGQAVLECALPILGVLNSKAFADVTQSLVSERIRSRSKPAWDAGLNAGTAWADTFLSLGKAEHVDVEAAVAEHGRRPNMTKAVQNAHAFDEAISAALKARAAADGTDKTFPKEDTSKEDV